MEEEDSHCLVEEEGSHYLVEEEDSHYLVEEDGRCLVVDKYPLEVLVVLLPGAGTGLEVGTLVWLEGGHCLVEVDTHY